MLRHGTRLGNYVLSLIQNGWCVCVLTTVVLMVEGQVRLHGQVTKLCNYQREVLSGFEASTKCFGKDAVVSKQIHHINDVLT